MGNMSNKETFLSGHPAFTIPQPWDGCKDPSPLPFTPPWPGDLVQEALASRAAMYVVRHQLPAIMKLPPEAQEAIVAAIFEGFEQDGLLSSAELESLRGVSKGRAFDVPLFNPDGSPSLCGVLGRLLEPSPERSVGGAIVGAALGAGVGAALGGFGGGIGSVGGAIAGALGGGVLGHALIK